MGFASPWGSSTNGRLLAAVVAFVINYACYFSEIYRGGIESVPAKIVGIRVGKPPENGWTTL